MPLQPELLLGFLGLLFLTGGILLWRTTTQRQRLSRQDPLREIAREQAEHSRTPEALVREMELRLYEYGREVEGRVETTLTVLDQLILDAQQEIGRLESLVQAAQTHVPHNSESAGTASHISHSPGLQSFELNSLRRIPGLIAAGMSDEEISRCLNCPRDLVTQERAQLRDDNASAA